MMRGPKTQMSDQKGVSAGIMKSAKKTENPKKQLVLRASPYDPPVVVVGRMETKNFPMVGGYDSSPRYVNPTLLLLAKVDECLEGFKNLSPREDLGRLGE